MSDSYSEVSESPLQENIKNAILGFLFAPILIISAIGLLWWNEGRTLETYLSLKEGAGSVIEINSKSISPLNNDKLIHLTDKAITSETLSDEMYGVEISGLRLRRNVESYQWEESISVSKKKTPMVVLEKQKPITTQKYGQKK